MSSRKGNRPQFERPPVVEAMCEFRFEASSHWDLTLPGLLYTRLRDAYPHRRRTEGVEAAIRPSRRRMQAQLLQTDRLQLSSDDRKTHVVIGRNFLAVTRTAPYGSWESFFPLIVTAASAYAELARPAKLSRIDLRYVNEFQFQQSEVRLADYFNFYPMVGDELDFEWTSFITGVAGTVGSNGDRLRLELTSVEPGGEGSAVLLEINCFSSDLKEFGSDTLEGWLNNAHRHIEDTFQGCMTEALRNQVGARPRA